ncbi:MAG: hypothetical protein ACYC6Y_16760 [Thermoguttaceae bacterium]
MPTMTSVRSYAVLAVGIAIFSKGAFAGRRWVIHVRLTVLLGALCAAVPSTVRADDSQAAKRISRGIHLDRPGEAGPMRCDVVQVLDPNGDPSEYFMDVDLVIGAGTKRGSVRVRIHFDPLGNYRRYELPSGGNLTKEGNRPFSPADHENLHRILSDPYSQLKSIGWDQVAIPKGTAETGEEVDAISQPTVLSKGNIVVVGAAYTCCTLWHWSHGEVVGVIRAMTIDASDRQDWIRYARSDNDLYAAFALEQLRLQGIFDAETVAAVVQVMREGSAKRVPIISLAAGMTNAWLRTRARESDSSRRSGIRPVSCPPVTPTGSAPGWRGRTATTRSTCC